MFKTTLAFLEKERRRCWVEVQRLKGLFMEQTSPECNEKNSHGIHGESCDMQVTKQLLNKTTYLLQAWDEAITRWAKGEYGICIDCGENIPDERLKAKPYAGFCISCLISKPKT